MTVQLEHSHLHLVVSRIPRDVRELITTHGLLLAGGFIRSTICGEKPNDIDLFCKETDDAEKIMTAFALARGGRMHKTENALTVLSTGRAPVQLITRWRFSSPAQVLPSFDFTIAQACVWADRNIGGDLAWKSLIADTYYPDLSCRQLIYTSPKRDEAVGGSTMRMRKFLRAGYQITAPSMAAIMARVFLEIRDSEMTSTEEGCAKVITGLLREVDPLHVIDGVDLIESD